MQHTEKNIWSCLKEVDDPELGVSIVDMGLIYKVTVSKTEDNKPFVHILMTLTTPGCPLLPEIDFEIRESLKKIKNLDVTKNVDVEISFDPPWSPTLMTEELQAEYGYG